MCATSCVAGLARDRRLRILRLLVELLLVEGLGPVPPRGSCAALNPSLRSRDGTCRAREKIHLSECLKIYNTTWSPFQNSTLFSRFCKDSLIFIHLLKKSKRPQKFCRQSDILLDSKFVEISGDSAGISMKSVDWIYRDSSNFAASRISAEIAHHSTDFSKTFKNFRKIHL